MRQITRSGLGEVGSNSNPGAAKGEGKGKSSDIFRRVSVSIKGVEHPSLPTLQIVS